MLLDQILTPYLVVGLLTLLMGVFTRLTAWGDETAEKWGSRFVFCSFIWPFVVGYILARYGIGWLTWAYKFVGKMWEEAWK